MRKLNMQDMAAMIGAVNQGYAIKQARIKAGGYTDSDHYGIVLAVDEKGNYVTWQFHLDEEIPDYYWGHYFGSNAEGAVRDYETRE